MTTYIKIFAGLCNRLFQYSYGNYLLNQGKKVKFIDANDGQTDILDIFDIGQNKKLFINEKTDSKIKVIFHKIFAKYILRTYKISYFQQPEYLEGIKWNFKNIESYQKSKLYAFIKNNDSISIHIRGGDYLLPENVCYADICTKQYYKNAISEIKRTHKSPMFVIFTNDLPYAKDILSESNLSEDEYIFTSEYSDEKYDDGFDLFLMSECNSNIIANSTFSWFGAYFNKEKKQQVICPEQWFSSGPVNRDYIYLPEWTKVKSK